MSKKPSFNKNILDFILYKLKREAWNTKNKNFNYYTWIICFKVIFPQSQIFFVHYSCTSNKLHETKLSQHIQRHNNTQNINKQQTHTQIFRKREENAKAREITAKCVIFNCKQWYEIFVLNKLFLHSFWD